MYFSFVALVIGKYDYRNLVTDSSKGFILPNSEFWFGTDNLGRDYWSQVWYATQTSIKLACIVAIGECVLGVTIGLLWGYVRQLDRFFTELYNVIDNIPQIIYMTLIALMAALTCILGPMSITLPFTPVPISFTNLVIYFAVMVIGMKRGTISYLVYLLIGAVGLPVFSGFSGGLAKLAGPTGGYLVGFIFLALISGFFVEKFSGNIVMAVIGMVLGTAVTYAFGTIWLCAQMHLTFVQGLYAGVIPYLPGDAAKIVIAIIVGSAVKKAVVKARVLPE